MNNKEAVEVLKHTEANIRYDKNRDEIYFTHEWVGAYEMAISALREQEERSKGCEYCTDCKSIYEIKSPLHDSYNTDVYISENALLVDIGCHSFGTAAIKFCPMCGRRLEEV